VAQGRRCDIGCESWPDDERFKFCPICDEPTTVYNNVDPLDEDEAQSILRHSEFERYYEEHCRERGIDVEGPLPD
jgi:hypothetical protein